MPASLGFRRGRCLLLRLGFGLRWFPPDRRCLGRDFFAIQISDAAPTFDSHPMLLTHDAFYRAEDGSAQRESTRFGQKSRRGIVAIERKLMRKAGARVTQGDTHDRENARVPSTSSLTTLARAASRCTACPLYKRGTQTIFGEGPKRAKLMLLGEQPGDQEDLAGEPFIGPAGKLLDRALEEAGINRGEVYVTNTVKHFKWEPRGKRRIHQKPNSREIAACRPWLEAEMRVVRPEVLICLGATAGQSIFGPSFRVTRERGKILKSELAPRVLATVHPSSLLRQPDEESREREYAHFVADLRVALKAAAAE